MTCLKMTNFTKYHHFQACRKWPNMITSTEFNASNHPGGPQGWLRWIKTRSIIFKLFCDLIFKIYSFLRWNASKSQLKTKMAFLQQKECPNKKIEENPKVLELNFLSNYNCASLNFDFWFFTEPYCTSPHNTVLSETVRAVLLQTLSEIFESS